MRKIKTTLKDQEFASLTLALAGAIENRFETNDKFNAYMTDATVRREPSSGFEVFTLRVIVTRKEINPLFDV